jgi:hypothetical protein
MNGPLADVHPFLYVNYIPLPSRRRNNDRIARTVSGSVLVNIRQFQPGDEYEQLRIYNAAAGGLTKFKPGTIVDLKRRTQAKDFDPATRLYAVENGDVVGYCAWQANGRIGFPWCVPGFESAAAPLFGHALKAMKEHGIRRAFTAYRKDWSSITDFFQKQGFSLAREIVNYLLTFENMPTPSARVDKTIAPATVEDIPGIFALDPSVFRVSSADALRDALWNNPYFTPASLFVMRHPRDGKPAAAGIFITNADYADPRAVDSAMPCFRLGAFGTEGMTTKRIKGLFSFVTKPDRGVFSIGMDLLRYASNMLTDDDEIRCYAAQAASDATALSAFYQQAFERQGSFPVFEKELA